MKILTGIQKEKITMGTTLDASTVGHPQNYFLGGQRGKTAMGPSWASLHGAHVGFLWATHSGLTENSYRDSKANTAVNPVWAHLIGAQMG